MSATNAVQQVIADLRYHWPASIEICVAADLLETQQAMLAEKDGEIERLQRLVNRLDEDSTRSDAYWQSVCEAMARAEFVDTKKVVLADNQREGCEPSADWQEGYREGKKFAEALQELREASEQSADTPSDCAQDGELGAPVAWRWKMRGDNGHESWVAAVDKPRDIQAEPLYASRPQPVRDDDPDLDGSDAAHPAWWRGVQYGHDALVRCVAKILDGLDDGKGVCHEPWESTRRRLLALVSQPARGEVSEAEVDAALQAEKDFDDRPFPARRITKNRIRAALEAAARVRADHFVDANKKVGDTK